MQAVDAAVRPEVYNNQFAFEAVLKRDWVRVKPGVIRGELWNFHKLSLCIGHSFLLSNKQSDEF